MKAAIVQVAGKTPVYGDFWEPIPAHGEAVVSVTAAALSNVVRGRASGSHYSSSGEIPFVVGVDGVGRLPDGRRVYFILPKAPFGSMAEKVVVPMGQCVPLPDGLDDISAAAMANPGMSSWAALQERAFLSVGETVLIHGATGAAGRLAVQIAKHLGAKKVIATGRNREVLESLKALGAAAVIPLDEDAAGFEASLKGHFNEGIDVVVDYLWGPTAEIILASAAKYGKDAVPIRYVQVGAMSGQNISLPAAALRSSALVLMGSGLNSVPVGRLVACVGQVFQAAVPAGFKVFTKSLPLADVEKAWSDTDGKARIVFTTGA